MVIVAREFAVSGLRMIAASSEVIVASRLGKWKTFAQMVAILALMLDTHDALDDVLVYTAVLLTVASAAQYFWAAREHLLGAAGGHP
jgi:CDP-diacylglycerol--glycerol-3-phosphate 3-phosphatidyltransferase